jgi:hypothetical protein
VWIHIYRKYTYSVFVHLVIHVLLIAILHIVLVQLVGLFFALALGILGHHCVVEIHLVFVVVVVAVLQHFVAFPECMNKILQGTLLRYANLYKLSLHTSGVLCIQSLLAQVSDCLTANRLGPVSWHGIVWLFAMRGFVVLYVALLVCALAVVHGMDGGDEHRRSSRKSPGKSPSKEGLSLHAIRALVIAGLTMPMSRRAALVRDRDPHVGRHATRMPAVGDRVWAEFSSSSRAHHIMLPATIAALNYDANGVLISVHVTWWHRYTDFTHRNLNQVYFRNEEAPGDFPTIDEQYSESYDDIMEERNYQASIGGIVHEMPSASSQQLPMPMPVLVHIPVHVPVPAGSGDTMEQMRVELRETHRLLAESRESLAMALAHSEEWRLMVQQPVAAPLVLGVCSRNSSHRHSMPTGGTSRAQGSSSGAQAGARSIIQPPPPPTDAFAVAGAQARAAGFVQPPPPPMEAFAAASARARAPRRASVHGNHAPDSRDSSEPSSPVEEGFGGAGAASHSHVVFFAPGVDGRRTGRVRTAINFYAPADEMDERPGDWWPGPGACPPGWPATGGAAS